MKSLIYCCLLVFTIACSTPRHKYAWTADMDFAYSSTKDYYDPLTNTMATIVAYPHVPRIAAKFLKNGRINRNPDHSCFNDSESFNYINIANKEIPLFRPYVTENVKVISYRSVSGFRDSHHSRLHKEQITDQMKVTFKNCVKKIEIDGEFHTVDIVSEKYSRLHEE